MFGINSVMLFGRVTTDPRSTSDEICGPFTSFKVVSDFGWRKCGLYCYSRGRNKEVTDSFKIQKGDHVLFHGHLFSPYWSLMNRAGQTKWNFGLNGKVCIAAETLNMRQSGAILNFAPCYITGMVRPGVRSMTNRKGTAFLSFNLNAQTEVYKPGKLTAMPPVRIRCWALDIGDVSKIVVPGSVVFCRGNLDTDERGLSEVPQMHCTQVESMGRVQEGATEQYQRTMAHVLGETK